MILQPGLSTSTDVQAGQDQRCGLRNQVQGEQCWSSLTADRMKALARDSQLDFEQHFLLDTPTLLSLVAGSDRLRDVGWRCVAEPLGLRQHAVHSTVL